MMMEHLYKPCSISLTPRFFSLALADGLKLKYEKNSMIRGEKQADGHRQGQVGILRKFAKHG